LAALAAPGRAQENESEKEKAKKKPGLFDFETWKSPARRERDAAKQLAPGSLDLTPAGAATGEPRTIRLRIYADRDYQSLVLRWQGKARAQIGRVNAVVEPVFGVRFEIESLRPWDRSHFGVEPGAMLSELAALDPAREVDWVLGLVTPLRGVATSIHQIGMARSCSRHMLMRGMDDEQEILALESEYKLLSVEERQRLYGDRKGHKEVVVFLHEWGHTMGLLHNEDRTIIMNPAYDPKQRAFSEFEKKVMTLVLERRLAHPAEEYPEGRALAELLAGAPPDEGSDRERAELLDFVRGRAGQGARPRGGDGRAGESRGQGRGEARGEARAEGQAAGLTAADAAAYNKAAAAANAGRPEEAWTLLAPVIRSAGARTLSPRTWAKIAGLAVASGAFSAAAEAAERASPGDPDARSIAANIDSERHRLALPLDAARFGVPPDKEPAYVAGYWKTSKSVQAAPLPAAQAQLRDFASAFPGAPGVDVLTCDIELRAKHQAVASKSCEAALAKFKGATRAHYLLGLVAARAGRDTVAEQHLHQAIRLDPADPIAWKALADLYRATGARQRLSQLAAEHQALLSTPLPE
jgi:tetratricopeptide (TPR) repeat protein